MNTVKALSLPGKLTIVGLIVAAIGIETLFLTTDVKAPPIPIGPILLLLVSALVAFGPWRWTPAVGVGLSVALLVGAFIAPGLFNRLSNPSDVGAFVGTWVQMLGVFTAIIAGAIATMQNYQAQPNVTGR